MSDEQQPAVAVSHPFVERFVQRAIETDREIAKVRALVETSPEQIRELKEALHRRAARPFVGRPGQLWWSSPAEIAKVAVELLTNGTGVTLDQIIEAARDQTAWASFVQTSRTEAANLSP